MIVRRRSPESYLDDDENDKRKRMIKKGQSSSRNGSNIMAMPFRVVGFCFLFFLFSYSCRHYVHSRGKGSIQSDLLAAQNMLNHIRKSHNGDIPISSKTSLITPEEDAALEFDANNDNTRYHVIFSTDCSAYQHWQSYLVYYTAMQVKQTGHVTRIASGCKDGEAKAMQSWFDTQVQFMSKRFHLHLTPHFSGIKNEKGETIGDYKFFNKPFGLKHWLEHSPELNFGSKQTGFPEDAKNDVVILIDPDMAILRPLTGDFSNERETVIGKGRKAHQLATKVGPGKPFAQVYGYGYQWSSNIDLVKLAGPDSPAVKVKREAGFMHYPAGPPYLAVVSDMYKIANKWTEFVPGVYEQYPHLLAEMFAYSIAAADQELPHQLIDSLMISKEDAGGEGWPLIDKIPEEQVCEFAADRSTAEWALPGVVHACQRYAVGKDWFFTKRKIPSDIYDCETPLWDEPPMDLAVHYDFKEPPNGVKTPFKPKMAARNAFMICYLYRILNEAATFYKQNACIPGGANLKKIRNLVQLMAKK